MRGGNEIVILDRGRDDDINFFGGQGSGIFRGSIGADLAILWSGSDPVRTFAGDDAIVGGTGTDCIKAGNGLDYLEGGIGHDILFGGTKSEQAEVGTYIKLATDGDETTNGTDFTLDADNYIFIRGDSLFINNESDIVVDFSKPDRLIYESNADRNIAFRGGNNIINIEQAAAIVKTGQILKYVTYVLFYNDAADEVFLVADLVDARGEDFETRVIFKGVGNLDTAEYIVDGIDQVSSLDEDRTEFTPNFFM